MATTTTTGGRRPLDLPRKLLAATKQGKLKWTMAAFTDLPTVRVALAQSTALVREDGYFAFMDMDGSVIYDIAPSPPAQPVRELFEAARANAMGAAEAIDGAMQYLHSLDQ